MTQQTWTTITATESSDLHRAVERAYGLLVGNEFAGVAGAAVGLTGSEKQVSWAAQIKLATTKQLAGMRATVKAEMVATYDTLAVAILSEASAAAWIDSRTMTAEQRLAAAMGR